MTMDAAPRTRILSGADLRRLLVLRDRLRGEIVVGSRRKRQEVLRAMEQARQLRLYGRAVPYQVPAMTSSELLREIKWRLDAASLEEATAAARVLHSARRRARCAR
ncbi:MAG: hypothetical protein QME77_03815 [bacterium]|nr:hypothetical protein [bacterium]